MKWPTPPFLANKKPGLVALLGAFCLTPVTVSYLFTADGQLHAVPIRLALWLLSGGMALFALTLLGTRRLLPFSFRQVLLFSGCGYIFFCASVLADRAAGRLWLTPAQHLVFAANSSARYQNPEFTVVTRINDLGFRDYPYPAGKRNKFRILVLGSSFTFGWGVDLPDTWVKQVEALLLENHAPVEVLNLGRIGTSPEAYWHIARKAIPALKPDLVLVSLLQGTEFLPAFLQQAGQQPAAAPLAAFRNNLEIFRANTYPNLLRLFHQSSREIQVKDTWQAQAGDILQHLDRPQQARFAQLPPLVRERFQSGNLNPSLVNSFLAYPDLYLQLEHAPPAVLEKGVRQISSYLAQIKALSNRYGAATVLLQVPNKFYLCEKAMREHLALGARIDTSLLRRNTSDSLMRQLAGRTRLPLLELTPAFRQHCGTQRLYYTYDSHMTPLGHKLFAREVFNLLKGYVPAIPKAQ